MTQAKKAETTLAAVKAAAAAPVDTPEPVELPVVDEKPRLYHVDFKDLSLPQDRYGVASPIRAAVRNQVGQTFGDPEKSRVLVETLRLLADWADARCQHLQDHRAARGGRIR